MRKRNIPKANDVCRIVRGMYLDVIYVCRSGKWTAMHAGKYLGRWPTKRTAKKRAMREALVV